MWRCGRKLIPHRLGRPEVTKSFPYINVSYPYGERPIATYIFHYRSRRMYNSLRFVAATDGDLGDLEIEGIVERPPSPTPPVSLEERDPDDLTPEELREQVRLLRARAADRVKIKQEIKREKRGHERSATLSDDEDGDITITSEGNRRKRAKIVDEEVVDLTDD